MERFDADPALQGFHARIDEAAYLTLPLFFEALCQADQEPEAVRMVPPGYLVENPLLLPRLLDQGTRLLRTGETGLERPWVTCPGVGVGQVVRRVRKVATLAGVGS